MRRKRFGLAAAICAVALGAGCAAEKTTGAAPPSAAAKKPAASTPPARHTTPAPKSSPSHAGSPEAASPAAAPPLPDGYDSSRNAKADIKAALTTAAKQHREVLVDFGADWCPDCMVLGRLFRSPQAEPVLRKDYVVVAVDVGRFDRNLDVARPYVNLMTSGIPALVVLKSDGEVRTATSDGSFANARTMSPQRVKEFLTRWAPEDGR
ncbi:thioredoxin family protein [Streptomyces sp. NPDC005573]|uniref:thioredoxin family protein n=1 Tax=Streptomyces sp. NPDC005573 TaxID=3156890 RepID=UPI0033A7ECA2